MAVEFYLLSFTPLHPPTYLSSSSPCLDLSPALLTHPLLPPSLLSFLSVAYVVPSPTITIGTVGKPYNGTTYSLTCTVTVDSSVDTDISTSSQWSYSGDVTSSDTITSTTEKQGLLQHTNLTFNPLHSLDGKSYTCTVDIEPTTTFVLRNSMSEDTLIYVKSEFKSVPMFSVVSCVTTPSPRTACP